MTYVVKLGDKKLMLSEGEELIVDGTFTNPKITVTPQPFRVFPYQGIRFNYPRSFMFEADFSDPDAKNWTLSGNDIKVMYFVINTRLTTSDFANQMIDGFGRRNCKIKNPKAKITLGKQTLSGTTIEATVATHQMIMDFYQIPSRRSVTKLLVFQDSLSDSGTRSKEGMETLNLIKSSFTIE